MKWIDSHCHLSDLRIYQNIREIVIRSNKNGISRFFIGGYNPTDWERQLEIKKQYKVFTSIGLHPWYLNGLSEKEYTENLKLVRDQLFHFDAIGETGLDYFIKSPNKRLQLDSFKEHIKLSVEGNKPMVLHIVKAHAEAIEILNSTSARFMIHSFSGEKNEMIKYLEMGAYISFSPRILSYKGLRQLLKICPLEKLLLESDSPDAKPKVWDSELNDPSSIILLAEEFSKILSIKPTEILDISSQNIKTFLKNRF